MASEICNNAGPNQHNIPSVGSSLLLPVHYTGRLAETDRDYSMLKNSLLHLKILEKREIVPRKTDCTL
jgi:hypothetical protein